MQKTYGGFLTNRRPLKLESNHFKDKNSAFVEVALNVSLRGPFTYRIDIDKFSMITPGYRVKVPFGSRNLTGYVVSGMKKSHSSEIRNEKIRDVLDILDEEAVLTDELLVLTRWASFYYHCEWGEMIRAALPGLRESKSRKFFQLTSKGVDFLLELKNTQHLPGLSPKLSLREKIIFLLHSKPYSLNSLLSELKKEKNEFLEKGKNFEKKVSSQIRSLLNFDLIQEFKKDSLGTLERKILFVRLKEGLDKKILDSFDKRAFRQVQIVREIIRKGTVSISELESEFVGARSVCTRLFEKKIVEYFESVQIEKEIPGEKDFIFEELNLTKEQNEVVLSIANDIQNKKHSVTLLHGITGSGKTEVYLHLVKCVLEQKRTALILVPEIGLTPQLLDRFRRRFGNQIACLHSAFSEKKRTEEWLKIRNSKAKVVIGTRSAVFAPLSDLGLIVMDEEHDSSYKQEESPRYNARDIAVYRAKKIGIPIILGSATPSFESFHNTEKGNYELKKLSSRPSGQKLPKVEIVDLRKESVGDPKTPVLISKRLSESIYVRLERGEQTLLFLNRRGFSSLVLCRQCGESVQCKNCSTSLTFHRDGGDELRCHMCDFRTSLPESCHCGSKEIAYMGIGTERVEESLRARFHKAKIKRFDRDSVRTAQDYEEILSAMRKKEIDILIGTQMVSKGHDFPDLTLVGVLVADVGLNLPDFRAGERTFQLLTQVSGRAGRDRVAGEVIVQTFRPDNYVINYAKNHDYNAFYDKEIVSRKLLGFPPFKNILRFRFESENEEFAAKAGVWASNFLIEMGLKRDRFKSNNDSLVFLGPAPAVFAKIRKNWRYHILIKSSSHEKLNLLVQNFKQKYFENKKLSKDVRLVVDIDPYSLL
tara:strand:+ start:31088 stop:33712 length:2625 start_codon:yes stop_codon:yes gene_type:complete